MVECDPFIKSQLAYIQLTLGHCIDYIWSRNYPNYGGTTLEYHRVGGGTVH